MIKFLKYHEIDFEKYTQCLENSEQYKYCATKQFLEITSNKNWDLLVKGDYEAVMPIPFSKKKGLKVVLNPKLCQQLGVFSAKDDKEINDKFLSFLKENFIVWYYAFNEHNAFSESLMKRNNYIIFSDSYQNVRQKYSPKRKRKLRQDDWVKNQSQQKDLDFTTASAFIKNNIKGHENEKGMEGFLDIFRRFYEKKLIKFPAFILNGEVINLLAIYEDQSTVALLGTFNKPETIKLAGSSVLIDKAIENCIEDKIFDFEGSDLPNVKEFFKGFRPVEKKYAYIRNSKKKVISKAIKLFSKGKNIF